MANEQNLIPASMRSKSEVRENSRKGGINSGKTRAERKTLRETLSYLLTQTDTDGVSYQDKANLALILKAMKGDSKAYEVMRDTIGEKPTDTVKVSVASFKGLEDAFNEMGSNDHTG